MTSLRTKQLFVLDDNLESPMAKMLGAFFWFLNVLFMTEKRSKLLWNCLSSWCVGILLSASWYFFNVVMSTSKNNILLLPAISHHSNWEKPVSISQQVSHLSCSFPPFYWQIDFFGIHTPPHHNYLNEGKMDVYNDNFVAGERVCKISRLVSMDYSRMHSCILGEEVVCIMESQCQRSYFFIFSGSSFFLPCLLRKSAARIFVHYINRQSFPRKK